MTDNPGIRDGWGAKIKSRRILRFRWNAGLALLVFLALPPQEPAAQDAGTDQPIFRRFALTRKTSKIAQRLFEIPMSLHPQSDPDAEINKNLGFNYVSSGRPDNRWYISSSLGFSKMEWEPSDPNVDLVKLRTFDLTFLVNRLFGGWMVTSFGLGLGVMDGLVVFSQPGSFSERLEPFIPVHIGLGARLGSTLQLGLKVTHFPFFRQHPVIASTRILLGIGYNY